MGKRLVAKLFVMTSLFSTLANAEVSVTLSPAAYLDGEGTLFQCECTAGDSAQNGDLMQLWVNDQEISFRQYYLGSDPESGELRRADLVPRSGRMGLAPYIARNVEGDVDVTRVSLERTLLKDGASGDVFISVRVDGYRVLSSDKYECVRQND